MTALTMPRPRTRQTARRSSSIHPPSLWAGLIDAAPTALRAFAVAAGIVAVGATLPALAHADTPNDPLSTALSGAGIGNNGSASAALAGIGQSICPSLVKPGATLASVASKVSGKTGLSPDMAGMVASMAIQMECPGVMTSLANGKMPFPMTALGANPVPSMPFAIPGANAAQPNPIGVPGH
jgi:hypothetical protein